MDKIEILEMLYDILRTVDVRDIGSEYEIFETMDHRDLLHSIAAKIQQLTREQNWIDDNQPDMEQ
jgi:hypothetical protein